MGRKVYVVGVFPTSYTTQCKLSCDMFTLALDRILQDQLSEYPEELVEEIVLVGELVRKLVSRGYRVQLIHSLSPHGLWLTFRYRLRQGFYVIAYNTSMKITHDIEGLIERIMAFNNIERPPKFKGLALE